MAGDTALYWTKEKGNLSALIHEADAMDEEEIRDFGKRAKERVKREYSWDKIVNAYETLFLGYRD